MAKSRIVRVSLRAADTNLMVKLLAKFVSLLMKMVTVEAMREQSMLRYQWIQMTSGPF
jgi:hypothetical protein